MRLVRIKEAAEALGVNQRTLRLWDATGKLKAVKTKGGHRRYRESDLQEVLTGKSVEEIENEEKPTVVYCRVSSNEQKQHGDLDRQKGRILDYCRQKGYLVKEVFEEVGSGLNDSRAKLLKMMDMAERHEIGRVVVEHKDRLTRFNKNFLIKYFNSHGVLVEWTTETLPQSFENELVEDMLSLTTSFSSKIYGKRSAENRNKNK